MEQLAKTIMMTADMFEDTAGTSSMGILGSSDEVRFTSVVGDAVYLKHKVAGYQSGRVTKVDGDLITVTVAYEDGETHIVVVKKSQIASVCIGFSHE